ncbi:MAG: Glucose-1-phosphate adenylyltransferase [Chlamydiae bacterium]|nr:Glucose-1-phosphate adenylyltransferase [Chlamydiota bacterium]
MLVNFATSGDPNLQNQPDLIPLDRVAVIILGGGEGKRLSPITKTRCKPAVSFGGRYSLIDVPVSHSLTTGLQKIFVIGQYLAYTLQKHLFQTYLHHGILQNQIQLLVPEERNGQRIWYKGTADAVRQNLDYFSEVAADYFLILSGDQLYNINFREMINFGVEKDAGMVIAAQPVKTKDASRMGILKVRPGDSQVVDFVEKPKEQAILDRFYTDDLTLHQMGASSSDGKPYLGSMGIYLFKRQTLFDLLLKDPREDFGKHLIRTQMEKKDVHAYLYDGYWEDIGTVEAYYHANLALTRHGDDRTQGLQCYDETNVIMTKSYRLPGAKTTGAQINEALLCEGSIVEGDEITRSVIGVRSVIGKNTAIRHSVLMGNEYYERPPLATGQIAENPGIGRDCLISKAIIDENVSIGNGVQLINRAGHRDFETSGDQPKIYVRDGIIVVPRSTVIPDNFIF